MSQVWAMRHGQTEWNCQRRIQGQLDSPLTSEAIKKLNSIDLPDLSQGMVICSDLDRALKTAQLIVNRTGAKLLVSPLFRERHFGLLQGQVIEHHGGSSNLLSAYHSRYQQREIMITGAESSDDFEQRLNDARRLIGCYLGQYDSILLVIHGEWWLGFNNLLLKQPIWQGANAMPKNGELFSFSKRRLFVELEGLAN